MSLTVLQLVQACSYEHNLPPPSTLSTTDASINQFIYLLKATGRELVALRCWPQLKKSYTIFLQSNRSNYQLPQDFYSAIPNSSWDQGNKWQMQGPLGDAHWNYRLYGYVTLENRKAFRVFGPDINPNDNLGQLQISPIPGDAEQDISITFDYISKSWLLPPSWSAGATISASASLSSAGNVYTHTVGVTTGTVPPNMANGIGLDGGVLWKYITVTVWGALTAYAPGDYVSHSGNKYKCTVGGISGATGPVGAADGETDGTVTWDYIVSGTAWAAETSYAQDLYVTTGGNLYHAVTQTTQKSGKVAPTWTATTVSDGLITWTYSAAAFESFTSDNDLVLFDDALMIAGIKYRYLRARGLEYQHIFQDYERLKAVSVGRWNDGMKMTMGGGMMRSGFSPTLSEGSWTF